MKHSDEDYGQGLNGDLGFIIVYCYLFVFFIVKSDHVINFTSTYLALLVESLYKD